MRLSAYSSLTLARVIALAIWIPLSVAIIAAPLLASGGATVPSVAIYAAFSPICHQAQERSFALGGMPWAVCQRCSGLYIGLALACCVPRGLLLRIQRLRREWVAAGVAPAVVDFSLNYLGIWANTPSSRFVTGLVFGATLSALLVLGIAELAERREARFRSRCAPAFGGSR